MIDCFVTDKHLEDVDFRTVFGPVGILGGVQAIMKTSTQALLLPQPTYAFQVEGLESVRVSLLIRW